MFFFELNNINKIAPVAKDSEINKIKSLWKRIVTNFYYLFFYILVVNLFLITLKETKLLNKCRIYTKNTYLYFIKLLLFLLKSLRTFSLR